ncbi:Sigma factor RpoE negative regulatory protein RseA [Polaromonas sp. CG9_12]|nr:Sigma factor RpoE negative regulatory protein RseA [Polaromonas sp. CG9_12]
MTTPELLSALADGQLGEQDFATALEACSQDDAAIECWNNYHLIGDFLRSPADLPASSLAREGEIGFARRLSARLARESVAAVVELAAARLPASQDIVHHRGPASNDGNFRWKLVAGVASLAAVSAIAWNASGLMAPMVSGPQLAQSSPSQIVVTSSQGPVVRDARLEELLAAHRQFGTASALQESSGFLRKATFETARNPQAASAR